MAPKNQGADFIKGYTYQARYNLNKESPGLFDMMFKMFQTEKLVEISRPNHLPIMLLHLKFRNITRRERSSENEHKL